MYTESGKFLKAKSESALGVVLLNEKADDFKAYVKRQNLNRYRYRDLKELESRFLKIDGYDANFSQVSGFDITDQRPVMLQYCYISMGRATMFIEGERTAKMDQRLFEDTCTTIRTHS
jgi:hypothetical protein